MTRGAVGVARSGSDLREVGGGALRLGRKALCHTAGYAGRFVEYKEGLPRRADGKRRRMA